MQINKNISIDTQESKCNQKAIQQYLNRFDSNIIKVTENVHLDMFDAFQHGKTLDSGSDFRLIRYDSIVWLFYWD
jgi:hypothetical protein